jgi:primosomal protein N' (replication factor Y)
MNAILCSAQVIKTLVANGFLITYEREVGRLNSIGEPHLERIQKLSDAQQTAYNQILMSFLKHNVTLLHGVTSSGKTEIYIHLIKQALERKQQVLYLLPEIALTVQIRERLQRIFGDRLGIYHSKYSDAERVEIWQKQLSSHPYDVILGARSAVLLPFQNLGLVIIDEEHETSFKQQDPAPRYHARSVAIMLAQMYGAKTLLGTATPSFESYYNAQSKKFGHVTLSTRYKGVELPEIQVVDIKDLQHRKMMNGPFSPDLISAIRSAINSGEQVILFQNRRGFAPMIECKECGWVPHCSRCDVSLTYHRTQGVLSCHYCGSVYPVPSTCPNCGSESLISRGYGTEKIEDKVLEIFPDIKVARMDLDTTRSRHAYERIITDFSAGRTQLLIGTQMVTKGLDFDNVSVVGILNADSMLNYPDFRAYEHAFMMMSQVSGRAGRRGKRGRVILQTKSPQLPVIRQVVSNDYEQFFNQQLEERHDFCYPPYQRLIDIYLKHKDAKLVDAAAKDMVVRLQQYFGSRVLGPDRPSVSMIKTMNIRKIVLKLELGIDIKKVRECLRAVRSALLDNPRNSSIQVYFDVDPL